MVNGHPRRSYRFLPFLFVAVSLNAFAAPRAPDCGGARLGDDSNVVAIRTDEKRQRTWVLSAEGLYLHDSSGAVELRRFALPGWIHVIRSQACPPDMTIDDAGAVLVSSNIVPRLWRVTPSAVEVTDLALEQPEDRGKDFGFTGLELMPRGLLRAKSAIGESRWTIDPVAGVASRLSPRNPTITQR